MNRLRRILKRLVWLVVVLLGLVLVIATPVERGELEGSSFHRDSLEALAAAPPALPEAVDADVLQAGGAKVEIAPPIDWDVPLGGNRRLRFARAEGKRPESVWARAVALSQGDRAFLLISADIMVVYTAFGEAVLRKIQEEVPIESDQLMLVAAHTHSGPGGYWRGLVPEASIGPYQQRLFDFLVDRLARAGIDAWRDRRPVDVCVGRTSVELPVENRARIDGPENATFGVLRLLSGESDSAIEVLNYAAHPTVLLRGNRLLTGDYPALLAQLIERDRPSTIAVFTPGTIGDQKPWFRRERDQEIKSRAIAETLFAEGVTAVGTDCTTDPVLEAFEFEVTMPPLQPRLLRSELLGSWAAREWLARLLLPADLDRALVQVARIGNIVFLGAPSDLSMSVAQPLLRRAEELGMELFFISMAEEWVGYVMTAEEYTDVDYKETTQFHGPMSGPLFSDVYSRLIEELAERYATEQAGVAAESDLGLDATK